MGGGEARQCSGRRLDSWAPGGPSSRSGWLCAAANCAALLGAPPTCRLREALFPERTTEPAAPLGIGMVGGGGGRRHGRTGLTRPLGSSSSLVSLQTQQAVMGGAADHNGLRRLRSSVAAGCRQARRGAVLGAEGAREIAIRAFRGERSLRAPFCSSLGLALFHTRAFLII